MTGRLEIQRSGVGFVILEDKRRKDIFISPSNLGDAWHGDRVAVALLPGSESRRQSGRIARVLERKQILLPVRVARLHAGSVLCQPTDPNQRISVVVDRDALPAKPRPGDVLLVKPIEQIEHNLWLAELDHAVGREDDPAVQENLVKLGKGVPTVFPVDTLAEAERLPESPDASDWAGRRDLRDLDFVTIDGATARDFDDAIYVEEEPHGYRLWVGIADVSHYVHPMSALDREARERGNSYYFPKSVEPMFPQRLSNGLCSLNPNVPRLAMVAEICFTNDGVVCTNDVAIYAAVIQSKARLTYSQVNRAVILLDEAERANIVPVLPMLERAERLARKLHTLRAERGSLDFDLPEPEIHFNLDGETVDIRPKVRHFGHQIIEEFMIAANEAVARFLTERDLPCLYRVHPAPDPDKLAALFKTLAATDLASSLPQKSDQSASPLGLQRLLAAAEGTGQEYLVSRLLLRSMMQAKYAPELAGHYGLASSCYCHFTSPIRRYADLIVHRSLKVALAEQAPESGQAPPPRPKGLKKLGDHLCERERTAMDAEREILKRITVLFLQDKLGEEYTGVISGLSDFGFWVELKEVMAEGLVRLSSLHDDYYVLQPSRQELRGERTGATHRLGQTVSVRLTDVNLSRLEVNLELTSTPARRGKGKKDEAASPENEPVKQQPERKKKPSSQKKQRGAEKPKEKKKKGKPGKIPSLFSE